MIRIDHHTQKPHTLVDRLEIDLVRMEGKVQTLIQKISDLTETRDEVVFGRVDQDEVVHISAIIADLEIMFDEEIELMEIDICEELAGEIAQR
jgi:hypothetical protein